MTSTIGALVKKARLTVCLAATAAVVVLLSACQSNSGEKAPATSTSASASASASASTSAPAPTPPAYIYQPTDGWEQKPEGTVLATAPITQVPAGGTGQYIQFRSATSDGRPSLSSGTAYFPPGDSSDRPVVVWAHGTVGMGDDCAPSKNSGPTYEVWGLEQYLKEGWVVVAPDYSGLGTPGELQYLVPQAATNDLANSVRAIRSMSEAKASPTTILVGISQGGFNVLAAESAMQKTAPELKIVAAVAESPAANIAHFVSQEWTSVAGWLVDTEIFAAWNTVYGLDPKPFLTAEGNDYRQVAQVCGEQNVPATAKQFAEGKYPLDKNPVSVPSWKSQMEANTPTAPPAKIPTLFVMGGMDEVIPANTQIELGRSYCRDGSNIHYKYYPDSGHVGPQIVDPGNVLEFVNEAMHGGKFSAESLCTGPLPAPTGLPATTPTALP